MYLKELLLVCNKIPNPETIYVHIYDDGDRHPVISVDVEVVEGYIDFNFTSKDQDKCLTLKELLKSLSKAKNDDAMVFGWEQDTTEAGSRHEINHVDDTLYEGCGQLDFNIERDGENCEYL